MKTRAFTLLEMVLASALAAIIGLAVAQVVQVSNRADARVRARGVRRAIEGGLLRRLDADLRAVLPPGGLYASGLVLLPERMSGTGEALIPEGFQAPQARSSYGDEDLANPPIEGRDLLTLAVVPPPASFGQALPTAQGAFLQVVYECDDDPDTAERGLVRRVVRLRDPLPGAEVEPVEVLDPAAVGLEVRCWDGTAWTDTWDSGASDTLPRAVQVRVARYEGGELTTILCTIAPFTARIGTSTEAASTGTETAQAGAQ